MARLPYVEREDLSEDKRHIYDRIAETRRGDKAVSEIPRVFKLVLNSPDAARAVAALGEYVRFGSALDPVVREIAILSTARELRSQYEWTHHEPIARRVGVRDQGHRGHPDRQGADGPPAQERGSSPRCLRRWSRETASPTAPTRP